MPLSKQTLFTQQLPARVLTGEEGQDQPASTPVLVPRMGTSAVLGPGTGRLPQKDTEVWVGLVQVSGRLGLDVVWPLPQKLAVPSDLISLVCQLRG